MSALLSIRDLDAGYNGLRVVRGLSLGVDEREVVTLLGANGAGKSTTLLAVCNLAERLCGAVKLFGKDRQDVRTDVLAREGLALVPESRSLFPSLLAWENLELGAPSRRSYRGRLEVVLNYFPELERVLNRKVGVLSGGEQQMVAIGRALMGDPKLIMIDELSLGLAPVVVQRILPTVKAIAREQGCGVLMVEQHIDLALGVADRGYVLAHGELVAEGSADTLSQGWGDFAGHYLGDSSK